MFILNKYTTWYNSIISNAKTRVLADEVYVEKHHIIPKSLGGNNLASNIVKLTAREHFICHLLLPKMVLVEYKKKMIYAQWRMANATGNRIKPTSKIYEMARKQYIEAQLGHQNYLLAHSEETKQRIRKTMVHQLSQLTAEQKTERMKNSCCAPESYTPERIENMRRGMTGKKKTKTEKLLAAEAARRERNIERMKKVAETHRGRTWKVIDGKRVWLDKETQNY